MEQTTLTTEQAANYLGISRKTLYRLTWAGAIPFLRVGARLYFRRETLDKWLRDRESISVQI